MKRLIACLLAALLLAGALPALADDVTVDQKFYQQAFVESAYRGTVTFEVSGDGSAAVDDAVWALLKTLAPRLSIEADQSAQKSTGEAQGTVTLLLDGQEAGKTTYLYNEKSAGFSSDLLSDGSTCYTVDRAWDWSRLLQAAAQGESAWPPLWRVLLAVVNAPETWKERALPYLTPYETKLGLWLNGYASVSTGEQEDVRYTEMRCLIPPQAVKAELKQLLVDVYGDAGLLTLLREIVTGEEAAAYLQPGMQDTFFSLLDALNIQGDVEITRRYNVQDGQLLLDQIVLPFAESQPLSVLTIAVEPDQAGRRWQFTGKTREEIDFDFSCTVGQENIYTGTVRVRFPAADDSFVVEEAAPAAHAVAFDYHFHWEPGQEKYTLATDRMERTARATLLVKPHAENMPDQSLTLEAAFSSTSDRRTATRLNATLTWRDLESGAAITAVLAARTAAPFAITSLDSIPGAVRVDLMDQAGRQALMERWGQNAQAWLQGLLRRLIPATFATVAPNG